MAPVAEPVTDPDAGQRPLARRRRVLLVAVFVVLAALAWGVKVLMERILAGGNVVDLAVISLRLQYNPGVAFSLGDALPSWVVIAGTAVITLVIAGYAWRVAPEIPVLGVFGLGAVVAGAVTNLVNRAVDGAVADYFHTGWFPTFNAPDSLITVGAVCVIIAFLLPSGRAASS
jgi:signal peptidase II